MEKRNQAFIFIDEFGTPALDVVSTGVEPYFICSCSYVSTQPKALYNWLGGAAICPDFKG